MCAAILKGFASCLYIRLSSSIEKGDKRGIRPILLTARPKSKYIQTIVNKDAPGYECVNINLIYLFKQIIFCLQKPEYFMTKAGVLRQLMQLSWYLQRSSPI